MFAVSGDCSPFVLSIRQFPSCRRDSDRSPSRERTPHGVLVRLLVAGEHSLRRLPPAQIAEILERNGLELTPSLYRVALSAFAPCSGGLTAVDRFRRCFSTMAAGCRDRPIRQDRAHDGMARG